MASAENAIRGMNFLTILINFKRKNLVITEKSITFVNEIRNDMSSLKK